MTSGMIFDIKRYAINDGSGIRTAIFFKGCPLECWWCHNPEGQNSQTQLMFRQNRCKASKACLEVCPLGAISWMDGSITDWTVCDDCGKCVDACYAGARELIGRSVSVNDLMVEIMRDVIFYNQSGGGVTFTGGEPMYQPDFLWETLVACKQQGVHTIVDTSGYASWDCFEKIYPRVDLFLYDLKLMDDIKHKTYTSMSNRLILNNLDKLSSVGAHLHVRIPLIPGVNDDEESIEQFSSYLAGLPNLEGVEVMPYHEIGVAKYPSLGMKYKLEGIKPAQREQITWVEEFLARYHLPVIQHFSRRSE